MDRYLFPCLLLLLLLTGCMDAAVTGASAAMNQHSLRKSLHDHYTSLRAERAIYLDTDKFSDTHVTFDTFNGILLMTGETPHTSERNEIAKIVREVVDPDIRIHNLIAIAQPTDSATRANDAWITAKIRAQLYTTDNIDPSEIKVITENGTVFLMGVVSHEQGNAAVEIARTTDGVEKVVRVFSWMQISAR